MIPKKEQSHPTSEKKEHPHPTSEKICYERQKIIPWLKTNHFPLRWKQILCFGCFFVKSLCFPRKISLQIPILIWSWEILFFLWNIFKVVLKCRNDFSLDCASNCALRTELAGTDETTCVNDFLQMTWADTAHNAPHTVIQFKTQFIVWIIFSVIWSFINKCFTVLIVS